MNAGQSAAETPLSNKAKYSLVSLALVVVLFVLILSIICSYPLMSAPEVALNLEAAKLLATGKVPYVDFLCLSSPLVLYGCLVPLLLAQTLNIDASLASNLIAWLIALVSVMACAAILLPRRYHREWQYFPLFLVGLAVANVLMLFQMGQAEHIAVMLFMPYYLVRWLRWNGHAVSRREAMLSGAFVAIGFCLWQSILLIGAGLEVFWLLSIRRFQPLLALEVRASICTASFCLLVALALPEAARTSYLSLVYPMLSLGYQCHDWSIYGMGSVPERRDIFYLGLAAILFSLPFRRRTTLAGPLVVMFLIGFGLYLSQLKGLSQSAIPMIFSTTLLLSINLGIVGTLVLRLRKAPRFYKAVLSAYAVSVLLPAGLFLKQQENKISRGLPLVAEMMMLSSGEPANCASWLSLYSRENDEVMFLTDSLQPGYPLVLQMKRKPSGYLLQSDFLVQLEACERESLEPKKFEQYAEPIYRRLAQDIEARRAKMIFVQDVTIDDLLKKHKVAETLLKNYELKGHARLHGANQEPVERTGFNYNIGVYLPRGQSQ